MIRSILTISLCGVACAPSIRLEVLEPSLVTSPSDIHTLAVVDRSRAKNVGQGILGALEGALTGEAIGADNEGRSRAMTSVVVGLRNSPRFDAAEVFVPRKELESSLFDTDLSWSTANKICKQAGCQGIVALEAFDSDSSMDVRRRVEKETDSDGNEVDRIVFEATRTTSVVTGWRYYDVSRKRIIDDVRTFDRSRSWTERGDNRNAAVRLLPNQSSTVAIVGAMAGADYSRRIAPTFVWVTRSYYGSGDDTLKLAKNRVKAMDWAGAADLWQELYEKSPEPKVRGRAAYNLALASEREGDLRNAASWATEGAVLLANGKSRSYRALLERRLAAQVRLEEQMKLSAPAQLEEERRRGKPLAKPATGKPTTGKPSTGSGNRGSTTPTEQPDRSTGSPNRGGSKNR
ncbi:MAG: DUF6340 family protein [Myxococcota bacterium]